MLNTDLQNIQFWQRRSLHSLVVLGVFLKPDDEILQKESALPLTPAATVGVWLHNFGAHHLRRLMNENQMWKYILMLSLL